MQPRWTKEQAWAWYEKLPWLVGCNFIPSTSINQLEMWQKDTFDPRTIDKELGWARNIGMNTVRVYLHDLVWHADAERFKKRIDRFLAIASAHGIRPLFCVFDDCWNPKPKLGKQLCNKFGRHNYGWAQSPGVDVVNEPKQWGRLEKYVLGLLRTFGQDERVLLWDLYNEPGNSKQDEKSVPLLEKTFEWAQTADPIQPLTSGVWALNRSVSHTQLSGSDIITFHNYDNLENLRGTINDLKSLGRPVICTEYMARGKGSLFLTHLPEFKKGKVGCYNWGLVDGKTRTKYPWGSPDSCPEPAPWFHEIFRKNGKPYIPSETAFIKAITKDNDIF